MKKVYVETETLINAPVEKVASFSSDPDNAPLWYKNIKSAEWKSPKPLREGSAIAFKAKFLGKELSYTYEILKFERWKKLIMRTAEGPFPMQTTYEWEEAGNNRTKMKLINEGSPSGFSALFAPFMSKAMRKANQKDLALLKELMEK